MKANDQAAIVDVMLVILAVINFVIFCVAIVGLVVTLHAAMDPLWFWGSLVVVFGAVTRAVVKALGWAFQTKVDGDDRVEGR